MMHSGHIKRPTDISKLFFGALEGQATPSWNLFLVYSIYLYSILRFLVRERFLHFLGELIKDLLGNSSDFTLLITLGGCAPLL